MVSEFSHYIEMLASDGTLDRICNMSDKRLWEVFSRPRFRSRNPLRWEKFWQDAMVVAQEVLEEQNDS